MIRRAALILALALTPLLASPAVAQDSEEGDGGRFVEVGLGSKAYSINAEEALTGCVIGVEEDLFGTGRHLTLQLFVNVEGIGPIPGQSFSPPAVGALAEAEMDHCYVLTLETEEAQG